MNIKISNEELDVLTLLAWHTDNEGWALGNVGKHKNAPTPIAVEIMRGHQERTDQLKTTGNMGRLKAAFSARNAIVGTLNGASVDDYTEDLLNQGFIECDVRPLDESYETYFRITPAGRDLLEFLNTYKQVYTLSGYAPALRVA